MGHRWLAAALLVFLVAAHTELAASPISYGEWQLSDFVMNSPSDANRRVYKEAPEFLSQLTNTAKNDSSAPDGSGLTLNQILSDLRAVEDSDNEVIPPPTEPLNSDVSSQPSEPALPVHSNVSPPPSKAAVPVHSNVSPPPSTKAALPEHRNVSPPPSKAAVPVHSNVPPPPSKAAVPVHSNVSPPPSTKAALPDHRNVSPPPSKAALPDHRNVSPPPSKAALPVHSNVPPPLSTKAALPVHSNVPSPPSKPVHSNVPPPSTKASLPAHSNVSPPPSKAALPPSPSQLTSTHSVVFSSGNGVIPPPPTTSLPHHPSPTTFTHNVVHNPSNNIVSPPSKTALPLSSVQTASVRSGVVHTLDNNVAPSSAKTASPVRSGAIPQPSKVGLPSPAVSTHHVAHNNDIQPPSNVASTLQRDVIPPAVEAALISPVQTESMSGVVYTSGYVTSPTSETSNYVDPSSGLDVNDEYLGSESIFVASDMDGYNSPVVGATNTAYTSVRSEDAAISPQGTPHAAVDDHYPSESILVTSKVNSVATEPTAKGQQSVAATSSSSSPTAPNSLNEPSVYNPDPTLGDGSSVATPNSHLGVTANPPHTGVASNVKTAPETIPIQHETQISTINPHSETDDVNRVQPAASTSQIQSGQAETHKPIPSTNTVDRIPTFQTKPVPSPVKPVPKSSAVKPVSKSPVSSTPQEKSSKAVDTTKHVSNTPKVTKELETIKSSSSMDAPVVVNTLKSDANTVDKPKTVDTSKPSNTKQVSDKLEKTKSASKTSDIPKVVGSTKSATIDKVPENVTKTKSASNALNIPKAADKSTLSKTVQVTKNDGKSKTEISEAVDKVKTSSNIMKVPEKVDSAKSPSKVPEIPEFRNAIKSTMWPRITPGVPKEAIHFEKTVEQKKRLLDKMLNWTQLLQTQERERQMEYAELLKELRQLEYLESRVYDQRAPTYPYRHF